MWNPFELVTMWEAFMLLGHLAAAAWLVSLWRGAPDRGQVIVILLLGLSLPMFVVIDVMRLFDFKVDGALWQLASLPMQFAVIVYLFRLWQLKRDEPCRKLRAESQHS